jgi:transcriptional regulator with XRE-family HTH domain
MTESSPQNDQVRLGIAARLRQERERLGLTQSQLADLFGVTRFTISNYESGCRMPTADQLRAMADVGADASFVLSGAPLLSSAVGHERFTKILTTLRDHCRLSKYEVHDDEIIKAAIFLAEGARSANQQKQSALLANLGTFAIQSLFGSLDVDHERV